MESISSGDPTASALPSGPLPEAAPQIDAEEEAPLLVSDGERWREEVAARLQRYRTRRKPREPRYPSLRLPFDASETALRMSVSSRTPLAAALAADQTFEPAQPEPVVEMQLNPEVAEQAPVESYEPTAKIIEFPRWAAEPPTWRDELAEPIFDRPRIVEAPEVVPPPPAMGGILLEPSAEHELAKRPEDPPAIEAASIPRRLTAVLVDSLVLLAGMAAFAAIFQQINPELAPRSVLLIGGSAATIILWGVYQFLFVVYTGSTPGIRAAGLRLVGSDGTMPRRSVRRWRVVASYLSFLSIGLGYLWSMLDEDGLCWHDRISRSYLR